jgi:VCBS repeat protein
MATAVLAARSVCVVLVFGSALAAIANGQDAYDAVYGTLKQEAFGSWVAPMGGDVDGDGVPDFAVYGDGNSFYVKNPGWIDHLSVISGATRKRVWTVDTGYSGTYPNNDRAAPVGDADGDGIPDLVSIEYDSQNHQAVLLRSGVDGHVVKTLTSFAQFDPIVAIHDVGDLDGDGVRDFVIGRLSFNATRACSGRTGAQLWQRGLPASTGLLDIAPLGDVDGDGVSDLARVGAWNSCQILSGATGNLVLNVPQSSFPNAVVFGTTVAPLGDITGDGIPDLVVTGTLKQWSDRHVWAISGTNGSLIWESDFPGQTDPWGGRVRAIGDVDGDGVTDLLVGTFELKSGGDVKLLSGATGALIDHYPPPQHTSHYGYDLGWGWALAGIGDLDGDGVPEIAIGDYGYCDIDTTQAGAVVVYNRNAPDPAAGVNATIVDVRGNGAFTDIQSAANAANDGDLILVRPGTYSGFTLSKRVRIDATSLPYAVDGDVTLALIAPGTAPAGLREMISEGTPYPQGVVTVQDCGGEVLLERVRSEIVHPVVAAIDVLRSPNVALTDCVCGTQPGVAITDSSVRATDLRVDVTDSYVLGSDGAPALHATNSTVILARPTLIGGLGGPGSCNPYTHQWSAPYAGGPGLLADASTITILGSPADSVTGGAGGPPPMPCDSTPGDGGDGIVLANGADVTISRVALAGGSGNVIGADWSGAGTFTRFDFLPQLSLDDRLRIGGSTELALDSVETGNVLLIVSTVGGFLPLHSFIGPPLSVLPGPGFLIAALGPTDAAGQLQIPASLPHDVTLVGLQLELQCALFANSGSAYLTNAVARWIGID